jgi:hypothetical protein
MKKLIPIFVGVLCLSAWSGLSIAVYGSVPSGRPWRSHEVAFVLVEVPLLLGLLVAMVLSAVVWWRVLR